MSLVLTKWNRAESTGVKLKGIEHTASGAVLLQGSVNVKSGTAYFLYCVYTAVKKFSVSPLPFVVCFVICTSPVM